MALIANFDINRLPLGNPEFSAIREENDIYVDKTDLIYKIANQRSPIFFSRPRRFGKSLLINTLSSLFSDGLERFQGLAIEKLWRDTTYQVVRLDFSGLADKNPQLFKEDLGETLIKKFKLEGIVSQRGVSGVRSPDRILEEIGEKLKNKSVVLLIDEYDAPLTHHLHNYDELQEIMSILNSFYSIVKQYTGKFRLIFITGVTRVSHVSIFSAFNNLVDLSLDEEYNSLLGFTQDNIRRYFDQYVENSAQILNMGKDEVYHRLEQYYDGFQFALDAKETVYNPWSILSFFKLSKNGFRNYWFETGGTSSIIMQYLKVSDTFDFLDYNKRNAYVETYELSLKYEIGDIPQNILLYQAGYLTIRNDEGNAYLTPPNTEVEESLLMLYLMENEIAPSCELVQKMKKLSRDIDSRNLYSIVDMFNDILNECVSSSSNIFNDERSVRDIIYAALIKIPSVQKIKERETVKGRSDLELVTAKTCMVIEFKRTNPRRGKEASLNKALEQLKINRYGSLFSQTHALYRVGMVISTEKKMILHDFCKEVS